METSPRDKIHLKKQTESGILINKKTRNNKEGPVRRRKKRPRGGHLTRKYGKVSRMDVRDRIRERIAKTVETANTDPEGKKIAAKFADGKLVVKAGEDLVIPILVRGGTLTLADDPSHPKAVCRFSDAGAAWAVLSGSLSPYAATVHRQLDQQGLSPMNETFEKLWTLVRKRDSDLREA